MKGLLLLLAPLLVLFSLLACAPAATPVPTTDPHVIQTQAVRSVFATQTASAPTPTPTAAPLAIPPRGKYNHQYSVTEEYNKFKGATVVTLNPRPAEVVSFSVVTQHKISVGATYSYTGTVAAVPDFVIFELVHSSSDWLFLNCHNVDLLLDGSRRMPLDTQHDGRVETGSVLEFISAIMPPRDFLAIANASKVEGKICNDEFAFTDEQAQALKDAASRMKP